MFASFVRVPAEARQKRTELDSSVLSGAAFDAARSSNLVVAFSSGRRQIGSRLSSSKIPDSCKDGENGR